MRFKFVGMPQRVSQGSRYEVYDADNPRPIVLGVVERNYGDNRGKWAAYRHDGLVLHERTRKEAAECLILEFEPEPSDDEIDAFEADEAERKTQ